MSILLPVRKSTANYTYPRHRTVRTVHAMPCHTSQASSKHQHAVPVSVSVSKSSLVNLLSCTRGQCNRTRKMGIPSEARHSCFMVPAWKELVSCSHRIKPPYCKVSYVYVCMHAAGENRWNTVVSFIIGLIRLLPPYTIALQQSINQWQETKRKKVVSKHMQCEYGNYCTLHCTHSLPFLEAYYFSKLRRRRRCEWLLQT